MDWKKKTLKFLSMAFAPIKSNASFFVFMYILGVICAFLTLSPWGSIYDNLYFELFADLYVACIILLAIPQKARFWIKGFLYIILYGVGIADAYCYLNFGSTLNPSILMLINETNSNEVSNFIASCLSPDIIFSDLGWIFLLILIHIFIAIWGKKIFMAIAYRLQEHFWWFDFPEPILPLIPVAGAVFAIAFTWSAAKSWHNKVASVTLFTCKTVGEVEHTLTQKDCAKLYTPLSRLAFSIYANKLAAQQITKLIDASETVKVDSCSFRSPNIVLIIGESFSKHHSQQYGYPMETTPRQVALEKTRKLTKFTDVVTCWNLTSFVFKNVFSTHVIGEKGEWCDYPLFPELFRKAGYHVSFITNEFVEQAKQAVYDFSGGFFLNNPTLSKLQFDSRNTELYPLDEGLLKVYDEELKAQQGDHNLVIFHLMGQHVDYKQRYRHEQARFWASSYEEKRPDLNAKKRKVLSHYDNATLYNDSIVAQIVKRFAKEDAIVIYMPDHGEECYEPGRDFICRKHTAAIDWPLASLEFEIPFWIYCSPKYVKNHRDIYRQIRNARNKRYMTDALPHLLLYLAGIETPTYNAKYNILSPEYDEMRPRILKGTTNYDDLRDAYREEMRKEMKIRERYREQRFMHRHDILR